jgi:hypothetical protein
MKLGLDFGAMRVPIEGDAGELTPDFKGTFCIAWRGWI